MVGRRDRPFEGAVESLLPVVGLTGAIWGTREPECSVGIPESLPREGSCAACDSRGEAEGPEGTCTEIGSASFGIVRPSLGLWDPLLARSIEEGDG